MPSQLMTSYHHPDPRLVALEEALGSAIAVARLGQSVGPAARKRARPLLALIGLIGSHGARQIVMARLTPDQDTGDLPGWTSIGETCGVSPAAARAIYGRALKTIAAELEAVT